MKIKNWTSGVLTNRVNWPITNHLSMTKHFGRSFSILLHFEWFKILQEHLLKLYKSSLECNTKKSAKKMSFFSFFFHFNPPTLKPHIFYFLFILINLKWYRSITWSFTKHLWTLITTYKEFFRCSGTCLCSIRRFVFVLSS